MSTVWLNMQVTTLKYMVAGVTPHIDCVCFLQAVKLN